MKIGIIGLPNSGKTTVFNALTRNTVMTGSYASPVGEHHLGQVTVPDPRFDRLVSIYQPHRRVPATVEFVDVAGIQAGGARGTGWGEEMVKFIKDVDALIHVVRGFDDQAVPVAEETIDPARDMATVDTEMILHDLVAVEKRLDRLEKEMSRLPKDKRTALAAEQSLLGRFKSHLEGERPLREMDLSAEEGRAVRGYAYLSLQPMMVILNIGEGDLAGAAGRAAGLSAGPGVSVTALCGKIEAEIAQLPAEDATVFMADLGISAPAADRVVQEAYALLGLQSFFTVGEDEVRAWTIHRGDNAVTAAGKIHSDLARGFIRAETVAYDDLVAAGSWDAARKAGKLRLEGKEYIVHDGDVMNIRFNV